MNALSQSSRHPYHVPGHTGCGSVYSREHEVLKRFRETWEGTQSPWGHESTDMSWPMPWLIASWVLSLGFPTNCVQNPSCWVFITSVQSSVRHSCSSLHLLQKRWELTRAGAQYCACSHPLGMKVCGVKLHFSPQAFFGVRHVSSKKWNCSPSLFSYQAGSVLSR